VRAWRAVGVPFTLLGRTGVLNLLAGVVRGDPFPQLAARVGGLRTVRGYTYGTRWGRELWAAQLDVALTRNPFVTPAAFVDAGHTFTGARLVGVGGGLSILGGLVRFNVAKGVSPGTDVRFDLLLRAPR
jgi:hemolysin activation/secretion protein